MGYYWVVGLSQHEAGPGNGRSQEWKKGSRDGSAHCYLWHRTLRIPRLPDLNLALLVIIKQVWCQKKFAGHSPVGHSVLQLSINNLTKHQHQIRPVWLWWSKRKTRPLHTHILAQTKTRMLPNHNNDQCPILANTNDYYFFFFIPAWGYINWFERQKKGERETSMWEKNIGVREKHPYINQLPPEWALTENQTCNLGTPVCPDQDSDPGHFSTWDNAPNNRVTLTRAWLLLLF